MNNTEVQGGSPNLAEVVKYIAERSANIKSASDKLRDNLLAIGKQLQPIMKDAGITHIGGIFRTIQDEGWEYDYQLAIGKPWGWDIYVVQTIAQDESGAGKSISIDNIKRSMLVDIVKNLPSFLQAYAKVLQEKEVKYSNLANIAERMAQAISS